ncbi:MAG TPA: YwmB family TATA-box binding protein [Desulfobacteria bacterium]|nr:YwmB family TATA-box binding protein [Desulfobacteria bacterium]
MDHLKKKKFVVICICMGLFVLMTMGFTGRSFSSTQSDEEIIIQTFNHSGAQFQRLTVRGWRLLDGKDYKKDPTAWLKQFGVGMFSPGPISIKSNADDAIKTFTMQGRAAKDVTASLTLAIQTGNVIKHKEAYLILSLESDHLVSQRLMKDIFNKVIGDETNKSIVITGCLNRKLSPLETNTVVRKMAEKTKLQNMETTTDRGMVSISGYSPNVRNRLTLDSKWVNINMALRYNSLEKRTMVYIGSPVISIEY